MAQSVDFFNFTKTCSNCNGEMKTFRIPLCGYNDVGECILTHEQKSFILLNIKCATLRIR